MAANILAPEWVLARVWSDYLSVSFLEQRFKSFQETDDVPWSRTHTYFANMGGFAIRFLKEICQAELGCDTDTRASASTTIVENSEPGDVCNSGTLPCKQYHTITSDEKGASGETSNAIEDHTLDTLPVTSTLVSRVATNSQSISNPRNESSGSRPGKTLIQETGSRAPIDEGKGES